MKSKQYYNLFLIVSLLFVSIKSFGQAKVDDEIILKTRVLIVDEKFDEAEKILNQSLKNVGNNASLQIRIYNNYVMLYVVNNDFDKALHYANLIKASASKTGDKLDDAYSNFCFARIYLMNNLYDQTILYANKALKDLENKPEENFLKSDIYRIIATCYARQGEYTDEYKNYVLKQLYYIEKTNSVFDIYVTYTDLTVMYTANYEKTKQQEDLDKASYYAEKSLDLVETHKLPFYSAQAIVSAYNNFASFINQYPYKNLSREKRREIAKSYIDKAIAISEKANIKNLQMFCYATHAEICDDKTCQKEYLEKAYALAIDNNINKKDYLKIYLASALKNIYKQEGNLTKALDLSEQELKFTKISDEKINNNRKKLIEVYYDVEQKKQQINQLQLANKSNNIQKFMFLGMLILAVTGLIFLFYVFRYKQRLNQQNTNILEAEIKESELVLKLEKEEKARLKVEQDLLSIQQEQLQKQALAVSIQLNHKNTFIKELKEKLKNNDVNIDRILRDERITENDFAEIKDVLHEVHPNFFKKLNSLSKTKLTNLDQKYAAYIYINMDNQKISNILKVDPQTVRVTKYRLKQKLGLDKTQDLQLFLQNLI